MESGRFQKGNFGPGLKSEHNGVLRKSTKTYFVGNQKKKGKTKGGGRNCFIRKRCQSEAGGKGGATSTWPYPSARFF